MIEHMIKLIECAALIKSWPAWHPGMVGTPERVRKAAEEVHHGEIGFCVTEVNSGIKQDRIASTVLRRVPGPQITVKQGRSRRSLREITLHALQHGFHGAEILVPEQVRGGCSLQLRQQTLIAVKALPVHIRCIQLQTGANKIIPSPAVFCTRLGMQFGETFPERSRSRTTQRTQVDPFHQQPGRICMHTAVMRGWNPQGTSVTQRSKPIALRAKIVRMGCPVPLQEEAFPADPQSGGLMNTATCNRFQREPVRHATAELLQSFPKCAILCQVMHLRSCRTRLRGTWYTAMLALSVLLTGCHNQDQADDVLSRYAGRVANVLEQEVHPPERDWESIALPRRRNRTWPVSEVTVGMLDALDLVHCDLLHEVGARNSSLGRLQQPSIRLHHEVRMLAGLLACRQSGAYLAADRYDFRRWLDELIARKETLLPGVFWNAVFAGQEIERLFSLARGSLRISGLESVDASRQALQEVQTLLSRAQTEYGLDATALEAQLAVLHDSSAGGTVLSQLQAATQWLNALTGSMQRGDPRRMCPRGHPTRRARILDNVFRTFYIGEVQPWLADLDRSALAWLQAFQSLRHTLPGPPPPGLQVFLEQTTSLEHPSGVWVRYRQAVPSHARAWQRWLKACALMPSN